MIKYVKVNLELIRPDKEVSFNVYLHMPLNKKYIHLVKKNAVIDAKIIERCKAFRIESLHVPLSEFHEFQKYLKSIDQDMTEFEVVTPQGNGEEKSETLDLNDKENEILQDISIKSEEERQEIAETLEAIQELGADKEEFIEEEASELKEIIDNQNLTSQDKAKLVKDKAKELIEEIFQSVDEDPEAEPDKDRMINHCKGVVTNLVRLANEDKDLYDNILNLKEEKSDVYDHSVYVSTFAVMFAMGMGTFDEQMIADIGLGALVHDLGITKIEDPTLMDREDNLTAGELEKYMMHCYYGADILRESNNEISEIVESIILFHHENYDGSGFPHRLKGKKIPDYVGIVSIADKFDMLTNKGLSPIQAFQRIKTENEHLSMLTRYKPALLSTVLGFINFDERLDELEEKVLERQEKKKKAS